MILIVGCGFLGSALLRELVGKTDEKILVTVRDPLRTPAGTGFESVVCDVGKAEALSALAARCAGEPLTVFYLAACHNVDHVYRDPAAARRINVDALGRFLETVPEIRRLFFASTDCVYGENTPALPVFCEGDPLRPVNVYGAQKAEAEALVRAHGFTNARFGYLFGPSLTGRPHFYDTLCEKLRAGEPVEMIDGMRRSVLAYRTAASLLLRLAALPRKVLPAEVNVCSDRRLTKYETALELARRLGIEQPRIVRLSEAEGKKFFADARASCAVMDNGRLKRLLDLREIPWEEERTL